MNINVSIYCSNKSAMDLFAVISDYDYENVARSQILAKNRNEHNQRDTRTEVNKSKRNDTNVITAATTTTTTAYSPRITGASTASDILRPVTLTTEAVGVSRSRRQRRDISSSAPTSMHGKW